MSRLAPGAAAIVVALPWEATPLAKHLGLTKSEVLDEVTRYHGWGGRLLLIQAGMGAHGAARALTSLETPSLLLSAGFCGGLRPEIGLADIIIGSQVVRNTGSFPADPFLLESASRAFKTIDCPVHVGTILTVDEVVTPADIMARIKEARKSGRKSVLLLVEGQGGLRFVALQIAAG